MALVARLADIRLSGAVANEALGRAEQVSVALPGV